MSTTEAFQLEARRFQQRTRQFFWAASVVVGAVLAVMALTVFVVAYNGANMRPATLQQLALAWAPALFYLWALWTVRGMFAALSRQGLIFHDVIATALGRIGLALTLGALVSIATFPFFIAIGTRISGQFAIFSAPGLTLGVVGLALIAVAGMIRRAARLETKAASLQAKLDEFF